MLRKGKLNISTSIRVLNMMMGFYAFFFLMGDECLNYLGGLISITVYLNIYWQDKWALI